METKICKYCKKEKELNDFDKKGEYYLSFCKECNTEKEVIRYCHYTNLQLLKAKDNLQKSAKLNWELH